MPKGDRKRRRRRFDENPEGVESGATLADEDAAGFSGDMNQPQSPVAESGEEPHEDFGDEQPAQLELPSAPPPRPAAVAQIMSTPGFSQASAPPPSGATPSDPFFGPASGQTGFASDRTDVHQAADDVEEDVQSSRYEPPPPRERGQWTGEPILLALLLVALIVLALDTYFTVRLNGLSDRLTAMAAKSAALPAATGDRPWVGVDSIKTAPFANGGQPVTTVHIVNSGRAAASDLRSNTVGSLRAAKTPAPDIPAKKGPLATTGLLLPNTGGNLTFFANTRALTPQEAASVRSGQFVLWLAGRLDYKDTQGRPHLTTFRYQYNPSLNSFAAAPQGNSAN
jgi:hypothetical protein